MAAPGPNLEPRTANRGTPPERRRHLKAEVGLSATARGIVAAAFEAGQKTYEQIAEEILLATGERIGKSSLGRAWREWRVKARVTEAREVALRQLAGLQGLPAEQLNEVIEQLLRTNAYESLAQAESGQIDPGKALRAITARDRLRLDERRLDLERRSQELNEARLDLERRKVELRERLATAGSQVEEMVTQKQITPEAAQKILAIYGLDDAAAG